MSRPAPIRSTTASAISETTRIPRVRTIRPPTTDRAPPCLTASTRSTFEAWSAGTRPNNRLVASETIKVKVRTLPSMLLSVPRTTADGLNATSARAPQKASRVPPAPATSASSRLSVINCLTIRPRPAPSAVRTAISRVRVVALPRSSVAVLAHAISSTTPTTPHRRYSVRRTSPTSSSCRRTAVTPRPLLLSGYCCSRRAAIVVSSACACSSETCGLRRATAKKLCPVRLVWLVVWGTQISVSPGKWKPAGITPTIGCTRAPTRIVRCKMSPAPPKRLCQYA